MNFNFDNPYASKRIPLFARNVVSTSHPLAAQAGLRMMLKGGNAVDAAIAAAAAMTIVEPVSNGLGSDAFCILWDGKELHGLNASGPAPEAWTPDYFKRKYGDGSNTPPKRGMDSVTVPGAVASWVSLSERFGKLPFADLMEPAIEIAERGYLMPPVVQQKWSAATSELQGLPGFAQSFLPWGRAPQVGELFQFKAAAKALRAIGASKGQAYYGGEIAHALEKFSKQNGGSLTVKDFANYKPEWVKPIGKDYRDYTLHEIPPNCDAPRWRYNAGLEINVEAAMDVGTLQALSERGHRTKVINDSYQDFGAGQFIWRAGDPKVEGYVVASDPRRDGQAVGF